MDDLRIWADDEGVSHFGCGFCGLQVTRDVTSSPEIDRGLEPSGPARRRRRRSGKNAGRYFLE